MAELITIARPYAKAVFGFASDAKKEAEWAVFLLLAHAITSDIAMIEVLKNPSVSSEQKVAILADLTKDANVDGSNTLLDALAYYGRLLALPAIADEYDRLVALGQQALEITITSAYPLDNNDFKLLETKLKTKYAGTTIRVETAVDQSLIGGFEIRSSDTVIDATVRGRLSKIAESLTA